MHSFYKEQSDSALINLAVEAQSVHERQDYLHVLSVLLEILSHGVGGSVPT